MTDCTSSLTRAPAPTSNLFQSATTTLTSPTWRFGPMQPYCSLGATVLGATIDFDPYSDQGHGNHKLDHRAQLWSTSQGRIPLKMSTVHRSNEGKCYGSIAYFLNLWRVNNLNQVWMRHSQRDLVMHTTPSNLDASFSLIFFVSCRTPLFIDKENGDNPNSEKNSLQFNKGSIWPSKERNGESSMPRKEESLLFPFPRPGIWEFRVPGESVLMEWYPFV